MSTVRETGRRQGFWDERGGERVAPLTGVLAVVLVVAGVVVFESADTPGPESAPTEYVSYFDSETGTIFPGTLLFALGILLFVWFAGTLRARLAEREGGVGRVSTIAFGGALGMAALLLAAIGTSISGAFILEEDDAQLAPAAAQALWHVGEGVFLMGWFMGALFLAATAIAALRTRLLPRWLGWVTLGIAVLLLIPWVGWLAFIFLMPLWILGVSILLWRAGVRTDSPPRAASDPRPPAM